MPYKLPSGMKIWVDEPPDKNASKEEKESYQRLIESLEKNAVKEKEVYEEVTQTNREKEIIDKILDRIVNYVNKHAYDPRMKSYLDATNKRAFILETVIELKDIYAIDNRLIEELQRLQLKPMSMMTPDEVMILAQATEWTVNKLMDKEITL